MVNAPAPWEQVAAVDKLGWVMHSILYSIEETFATYGIELPTLRYLALTNQPVHDCEQVTVSLLQSYLGVPGDQAEGIQTCEGPRSGVFHVEVVRCVPQAIKGYLGRGNSSTKPDPAEMFNYVQSRTKDAFALLDVPKGLDGYNGAIADVAITEPQGEFQAVVLNLVVAI